MRMQARPNPPCRCRWLATGLLALLMLPAGTAQEPPRPATPELDMAAVESAVRDFYAAYWRAWEAHDRAALADLVSREFTATSFVPGSGVVTDDYARTVAALGIYFDTMRGQQMAWNRNLLTIMVRSATEAVVAIRTGFVGAGLLQSEVSLEVIRREADGRWRMVRRWSEKHIAQAVP